jgi:MarR family transcriptional regulator, organic hydroperoxide resistance regulator
VTELMTHDCDDVAALADSVERALREIRQVLRRPLDAEFARGGLTGPQRTVMQAVFHSEGLSLKEIGARVGLTHSTLSGIVDRLAARGLLERRVNSTDRRLTSIVVTKVVRDFMAHTAPGLTTRPLLQALGRATTAERKAITNGLRILQRVLEDEGLIENGRTAEPVSRVHHGSSD